MSVVSSLLLAQHAYILEMNQIATQYMIGLMQKTKSETSIGIEMMVYLDEGEIEMVVVGIEGGL